MKFFNWDLMFVLPSQFVNLMLANGVVYENEEGFKECKDQRRKNEYVEKINEKISIILEKSVKKMHLLREWKPSIIACAIIYIARKETLI
jgi:hypothetical protein